MFNHSLLPAYGPRAFSPKNARTEMGIRLHVLKYQSGLARH